MLQNEVKIKDELRAEIARKIAEFGEENIKVIPSHVRTEDSPVFRLGVSEDE